MAARLVAGRIGGLPVAGGHVSLENAEMAQVIHATTGLVREATNTGIKLAALGVGGALILGYIAAEQREKEKRERDRAENPPRSMSGICSMETGRDSRIYGICLDRTIKFQVNYGTTNSVAIEHVVAIERDRDVLFGSLKQMKIELIDGSVFRNIELLHPINFLTLAGVVTCRTDFPSNIEGLGIKRTLDYKGKLVEGLKQTRAALLNEIGIDLVRKYFHIEDAVFEEVTEPTLRLPAQPEAPPPHIAAELAKEPEPSFNFLALAVALFVLIGAAGGVAAHTLFGS